jgi:hypothetical protein
MKIFISKKERSNVFALIVRAESEGIIGDAFGELRKGGNKTFFGLAYNDVNEAYESQDFKGFIEIE